VERILVIGAPWREKEQLEKSLSNITLIDIMILADELTAHSDSLKARVDKAKKEGWYGGRDTKDLEARIRRLRGPRLRLSRIIAIKKRIAGLKDPKTDARRGVHTKSQCFKILGIKPPATAGQVKAAYRDEAKELHPDRGGDAAKFHELQEAYEQALKLAR
jgi:hypothetical protein